MESLELTGECGGWAEVVQAHNPFYLLSAFSMLVGCWVLSRALALEPGHAGKLLLLLVVLNLYEALLIGLALVLIVRHGLLRDGKTLLWLESAFLVDATFVGSELYASDLWMGALVATSLLVLAGLKLGAIARVLRVRVDFGFLFCLVPLAGILAVPGGLAALARTHFLTLPIVYLLWWVLALLIVAQGIAKSHRAGSATTSVGEEGAAALQRALGVLPAASLALHLMGAAWVQGLAFFPSLLGPPLLALGIGSMLSDPSSIRRRNIWWPLAAILLSIGAPNDLFVTGPHGLPISPLRVVLAAAAVAYGMAFRIHRSRVVAWGAALCLLGAGTGHTPGSIFLILTSLVRTVLSWAALLVPRSRAQWGGVTIGLSFVLLALGARKSLRGSKAPESSSR